MRPARSRPDGVRSCRPKEGERGKGGTWVECATLTDEGGVWTRIDEYAKQGPPAARSITISAVEDLLDRAAHGELHLRPRSARGVGEVVVMGIRPEVLELVAGKQYINGVRYHLRLYFTEPIDQPGVLLLLSVAWKQDHPLGKKEQDGQAKEAFRRLRSHCST